MGETETMSSWNSLSSSNHCINDDAEVEFISSLPAVLPVVDNTNKNGPNEGEFYSSNEHFSLNVL